MKDLRRIEAILYWAVALYLCLMLIGLISYAKMRGEIMTLKHEREEALADLLQEMIETRDSGARKRLSNILRIAFKRELAENSCLRSVLVQFVDLAGDEHGTLADTAARELQQQLHNCREQN